MLSLPKSLDCLFLLSPPSPTHTRKKEREKKEIEDPEVATHKNTNRHTKYTLSNKLNASIRTPTDIPNIHYPIIVIMYYLDSIMGIRELRSLRTLDGFNCATDFIITCKRSYITYKRLRKWSI
jgi:hypothetical protein